MACRGLGGRGLGQQRSRAATVRRWYLGSCDRGLDAGQRPNLEEALNAITTERTDVPVQGISAALAELWEQCKGSEDEPSLSRTLTMNLIAVIHRSNEKRIVEARSRLLTRHPCRAFEVLLDEERGEITAEVSVETRLLRSCRQMVLEQVTLLANPRDFRKLSGLIRPLLVNDIPVHQYWGMELPGDISDLQVLGGLAEQTTVDSSLFTDPARDLDKLRKAGAGLRIVDLSWFRLRPWRRGLAEAFEHFTWDPDVGTDVTIQHGPGPGALAASLCLAHWLQQRLGTETKIPPSVGQDPSPEPQRVDLRHGKAQVCVIRRGIEPRLEVEVTLEDLCMLPFEVVASRGQPGDLLAAAVDAH